MEYIYIPIMYIVDMLCVFLCVHVYIYVHSQRWDQVYSFLNCGFQWHYAMDIYNLILND